MNATKQVGTDTVSKDDAAAAPADGSAKADTQPPPSGTGDASANRGSPAAPVMKQFAKTQAESTGRP